LVNSKINIIKSFFFHLLTTFVHYSDVTQKQSSLSYIAIVI